MDKHQLDALQGHFQGIIDTMGWADDENFYDTPKRVAKYLAVYLGLTREEILNHVSRHMAKKFRTKYQGIVSVGPTKVYSMCPHHMLPIEYDVYIGLIPNQHALGLSKYTRIAIEVARYPYIQEDYTKVLGDTFQAGLSPQGVIIVVEGIHNCMRCRGVKDLNSVTKTSYITGVFAHPPEGKDPVAEFYRLNNHGR